MEKRITVSFPGSKRVDARIGGLTVQTDQLPRHGGDGSAPTPFDLLFVSLATCAGISALEYLQQHALQAGGLGVTLVAERHAREPRYDRVRIEVALPDHFPEEHLPRLLDEIGSCAVKRQILQPPVFEVVPRLNSRQKPSNAVEV